MTFLLTLQRPSELLELSKKTVHQKIIHPTCRETPGYRPVKKDNLLSRSLLLIVQLTEIIALTHGEPVTKDWTFPNVAAVQGLPLQYQPTVCQPTIPQPTRHPLVKQQSTVYPLTTYPQRPLSYQSNCMW